MLDIQPQYLSLSKLLAGRIFHIPQYQRSYSWTKDQRKDLFDDIEKVHSKGPASTEGHFMATIVCLQREKKNLGTDEFTMMDIVDGQQRLTTLIILLQTIKLELSENEQKESKSRGELNDLLVKLESNDLLLLQTNHDSSFYFSNFLRNGTTVFSKEAENTADRELLRAIEEARVFVTTWKDKGRTLLELLALLKNRLFFLLHETSDEKSVYTVFEVLNSRGLDVSWMDRFKSLIMGAAFDLKTGNSQSVIDDLHNIWRKIYLVVGLRQRMPEESLRFAATLRKTGEQGRLLSEQKAVEELCSKTKTAKDINDVASWLLEVVEAYNKVVKDENIRSVTQISQARFLAVAIHLRQDISPKERQELLHLWEKVSFRIFGMMRLDPRNKVGDYVRLARQVINDKISVSDIDAGLREIGKEFPIDKAVDNMKRRNCYEGWEDELRYFMFRREEHLAKAQGLNYKNAQWRDIWANSPERSIEHIYPQTPKNGKSLSSEYCHSIGNLMLLTPGLNAKLQNDDLDDKSPHYRQTGLLVAIEVADAAGTKKVWSDKDIESREKVLLEWAKTAWAD